MTSSTITGDYHSNPRKWAVMRVAGQIKANPNDPDIENQIAELIKQFGKGIQDDIIDALVPESYSDTLQDYLNQHNSGKYLTRTSEGKYGLAVSVLQLDYSPAGEECYEFCEQLIAREVSRIPKEAGFTRDERRVWFLWLRRYSILRMAVELQSKGHGLSLHNIRSLRDSAVSKVQACRSLGWTTAYAEDQARGPNLNRRPGYWSLSRLLSDD